MNGQRAKPTCPLRRTVVLAACLAAASSILYFALSNGGKHDNALSEREAVFVDGWRLLDRAPTNSKTMKSVRFEVIADTPEPELEAFNIENTSNATIGDFWLCREGAPNFHDALTIVESVTAGYETDAERATALFNLFPKFYENFYPSSDGGLLYEPAVLLAVFGWGQCNIASHDLETLYQLAGFETRGVGLETPGTTFAHKALEVFFDGTWHYVDPDGRVLFKRDDGSIASVADLKADPGLIRRGPAPSGYDHETYAAAFERGKVEIFEYPTKFRMAERQRDPAHYPYYRHIMRYDLPPRTSFRFEHSNRGLFYSERKEVGPPPCWANGVIRTAVRGSEPALWQPFIVNGALILPVVSPYILVGGRVEGTADSPLRIAWLPFRKGPTYRNEWIPLVTASGNIRLDFSTSFHEKPIFGYALKIDPAPLETDMVQLDIVTDFQHNPKAFPLLEQGQNTFYLYAPQATEFEFPPAGSGLAIRTSDGLRVMFELETGK